MHRRRSRNLGWVLAVLWLAGTAMTATPAHAAGWSAPVVLPWTGCTPTQQVVDAKGVSRGFTTCRVSGIDALEKTASGWIGTTLPPDAAAAQGDMSMVGPPLTMTVYQGVVRVGWTSRQSNTGKLIVWLARKSAGSWTFTSITDGKKVEAGSQLIGLGQVQGYPYVLMRHVGAVEYDVMRHM